MKNFFNNHKTEVYVFSLALAIRLIFFLICLNVNGGNVENTIHGKDWYFEISKNLLLGNGFSAEVVAPFKLYSYGVPGYPYFLFFLLWLTKSYVVVAVIQMILGAVVPIIGMRLARLLVPFNKAPLVVGILLAIAPYQTLFSFIFYTETFFTVLFGVFLILFLNFLKNPSTKLALWSGLLLGLSTLTKPTVQYLIFFVFIFVLWYFRKSLGRDIWLKLGYFVLVFFLVLSPWIYRNYKNFNTVGLSSQVSFNLFTTLLPSILAIENQLSFNDSRAKLSSSSGDVSSSASGSTLAEILRHPIALTKLAMISSVTFFTHDGMLSFLQAVGIKPNIYLREPAILMLLDSPIQFFRIMLPYMSTPMVFVFIARLFWILMTLFFVLGIVGLWRLRLFSPQVLFSVLVVLYFMFTTMINGLTVNARFRMPVEPLIFIVAYAGFVFLYQKMKKKFVLDNIKN